MLSKRWLQCGWLLGSVKDCLRVRVWVCYAFICHTATLTNTYCSTVWIRSDLSQKHVWKSCKSKAIRETERRSFKHKLPHTASDSQLKKKKNTYLWDLVQQVWLDATVCSCSANSGLLRAIQTTQPNTHSYFWSCRSCNHVNQRK